MVEPTPQPAPGIAGGGRDEDRERTIDSLLVTGLDLYFAGDYEQAIHAWTRVLFLDRTHPRARAYIERARSVLAERQRETDELLHRGLAALDAGETDFARSLLSSAVNRGGAVEAAQTALDRLERLNVASGGETTPQTARRRVGPPVASAPRSRQSWRVSRGIAVAAALAGLLTAAILALGWEGFDAWGRATPPPTAAVPSVRSEAPLPQPRLADLALRRARALYARGHLHEALAQLDVVGADHPRRAEADRLRADVQRSLLAGVGGPSVPEVPAVVSGRP